MLKALRGTRDILPGEIEVWQSIEKSARDIFSIYGYREIRTPIIEEADLFVRSIGECTDIVKKEMYVFSDRGGRNIALRPEATASVARAYIENYQGRTDKLVKLFYIGPMFRSERPQKGRQRQFHQLGVEAIGSDNPSLDVEIVSLAMNFLELTWLTSQGSYNLKINSLGCQKDKLEIIENYRKIIKPYLANLCEECKVRYNKNVLRIFDCKNSACGEIIKDIETIDLLCSDCEDHFEAVKKGLDLLKIHYVIDPRIVRGLDYYTKTVFEITQEGLGAQDAVCAGGRYNNLIKDMGGKDTPAIGFAFGIERLLLTEEFHPLKDERFRCFIVRGDKKLFEEAFKTTMYLRSHISRDLNFTCDINYEEEASMNSQMRKAQRAGAKVVIIFGDEEFKKNKVLFKDMDTGEQEEVEYNQDVILNKLEKKIKK